MRAWLSAGAAWCLVAAFASTGARSAQSAEVLRLDEGNWDATVPQGKEVDAIYGDWVVRNRHIITVIGAGAAGRNANMTVRNVGGSVIDLTTSMDSNDQLSAYYPVGIGYKLSGPDEGTKTGSAGTAKLLFQGPAIDDRSSAEVIYELILIDDCYRCQDHHQRLTNTASSRWS